MGSIFIEKALKVVLKHILCSLTWDVSGEIAFLMFLNRDVVISAKKRR